MIWFSFRRKIRILENLPHISMIASQHVKTLLKRLAVRFINLLFFFFFWYYVMKCVNIWKICVTQWIHIFKRLMHHVIKSYMQDKSVNFNVTEYRKFTDVVWEFTLQAKVRKLPLWSFSVLSKKTIHSYVQRLLKYSSLSK